MPRTTLDALPSGSKVWVLAANRELSPEEQAGFEAAVAKVADVWDKKQPGLGAWFEIRDGQVLVAGADQTHEMLDGCTVDAMMNWLGRFEKAAGVQLTDRITVHYRDRDGHLRAVSRAAFRKLYAAGEIDDETIVLDTAIATVEPLREGRFELPLA